MRNYLAFAAKAKAYDNDPKVQEAESLAGVDALGKETIGKYSSEAAAQLKLENFDYDALANRNYYNERLDQLALDHIFGL
jgi:xylose isomerase